MDKTFFYALRSKYPKRKNERPDHLEAALAAFVEIDPLDYADLATAVDRYAAWVKAKGPDFPSVWRFDNFLTNHWRRFAPVPPVEPELDLVVIHWGPRAQA